MIIIPIDVDGVNLHIPLTQRVLPGGNLLNNGGIGLKFNLIRGWSDFDSLQANFYWSADTTIISPKDGMPYSSVQVDENNIAKIPSDLLDMQSGVLFVSITSKSGDTCGSSLFGRFDIYNSVNNAAFATGEFYADQDYHLNNPVTIEHNLGRAPTYFFMVATSGIELAENPNFIVVSVDITNYSGGILTPPSTSEYITTRFCYLSYNGGSLSSDPSSSSVDEINDSTITFHSSGTIYIFKTGTTFKWFAY